MKKLNKKIFISIALILITLITFTNNVFAIDVGKYDPHAKIDDKIGEKASVVLGYIKFIGMVIAIVALAIIGLKYMFTSVEGKAEYKKAVFPYVIGCFMLMGVSLIIQTIGGLFFNI